MGIRMKYAPINIVRVNRDSTLGKLALNVMDSHNNGRITQESLDMFREDYSLLEDFQYHTVIMAAIFKGEVIGISAGVVDGFEMLNGITVVHQKYRRLGVGFKLMMAKAKEISNYFPNVKIATKVAANNIPSMRSLIKANFKATEITTHRKNNGSLVDCFTFTWPK